MNDALQPSQSYCKMYRKEPWYNEPRYNKILVTMNTIQKPKHITYPKRQQTNVNMCLFKCEQTNKNQNLSLFLCLPVSLPLKFVLLAVVMNRPVQCTAASYTLDIKVH